MIVVDVLVRAPLAQVWEAISDLASHPTWMKDAHSLRFIDEPTAGPGTRMVVDTRIGPFRVSDVMEVTRWEEPRLIEVDHRGLVVGRGHFQLDPLAGGTRVRWVEELRFPSWLGGAVTAFVARPVLAWIWRRNLAAFRRLVEVSGR